MTESTDIVDMNGNTLVLVLAGYEAIDDPLGARSKIRNILYERYGPPWIQDDGVLGDVYVPSVSLVFLLKRQGVKTTIQTLRRWYELGYIRGVTKRREYGSGGGIINHYHVLDVYEEWYKERRGRSRSRRTAHWSMGRLVQEWKDGIGS